MATAMSDSHNVFRNHRLIDQSSALRFRVQQGEPLSCVFDDAIKVLNLAARQTLGMEFYPVQIEGGRRLAESYILEMETGEGKTFTATIPLFLHSLSGRGVHLATANDYLARRDAQWMSPLFQSLGVSVGYVVSGMNDQQRRLAYRRDIVYSTCREIGFDFLRDRMRMRHLRDERMFYGDAYCGNTDSQASLSPVQDHHQFILIDEADSLLIDEARTPLIISSPPNEASHREVAAYKWGAELVRSLEETRDFIHDHEKRKVTLSRAGTRTIRQSRKPKELDGLNLINLYDHVERAIKVKLQYARDQHYIVKNDQIVIVDEATGRMAPGRRWQNGIHQAVEAREGLPIAVETGHSAKMTLQDLMRQYSVSAGMTGTAWECRHEFKQVYGMRASRVSTHFPCLRKVDATRFFQTESEKWQCIRDEVIEVTATGRPVLVGTRTIESSNRLSAVLNAAGVEHVVLNAQHVEREAEIVARAGSRHCVTVATNMAGRGTDIKLDATVAKLGGLHVICSEMHESARIDRQLFGRCARQGDPGSIRQYCSAEDTLLDAAFGFQTASRLRNHGNRKSDAWWIRLFQRAQRRVDLAGFKQRRIMLHLEAHRSQLMLETGRDPFLDSADAS